MDIKRSIEELSAIYAVEPEIRDVFVEGATDKLFIEWYLCKKGIDNVSVYTIELIDISDEVLSKHNLRLGSNRCRVIALSCELEERCGPDCNVICIADRDFEDYCPSVGMNSYLSFTDGNALELYAFTPSVIEKFLLVALGGFPLSTKNFIDTVGNILNRIFAIRLTNERLRWGMSWIPFTRYINVSRTRIEFMEDDYIRAYLQKNNKWDKKKEFQCALAETTNMLPYEQNRKIRGHDLAELTLLLVRKLRSERNFGNCETIEGCLLTTIEASDLDTQHLFDRVATLAK